jgi:hypothetical protein
VSSSACSSATSSPLSYGICITVRDSGPGIDPEEHHSLFSPYSRVRDGNFHAHSSGLGLAIAKKIVQLHGGEIGVSSEAGVGAEFWVRLKMQCVMRSSSGLSSKTNNFDSPHSNVHLLPDFIDISMVIFIADDSKQTCLLMEQRLRRLGFKSVSIFQKGKQVVKKVCLLLFVLSI